MRSIEFNDNGSRRVRNRTAEDADRQAEEARRLEAERQREKNRRDFEEHRRLSQEPGFIARAQRTVQAAAKRIREQAAPLKKRKKQSGHATGGQMPETARGDDRHISVPIQALNKAAVAGELYAVSRFLQGAILASVRGNSEFAKAFREDERGLLIDMASYVRRNLPHDMRLMAEVIVAQHADPAGAPTLSDIGGQITSSEDERVRKGGVVGYYRALFQAIADLQKEYMIGRSAKRLAEKRGAL